MIKLYRILTISDATTIETWKVDDFLKNVKKMVRIVLYGPAVSQSDCRKPCPHQLPCGKIEHNTILNFA